jgi:DNA invertase Pin-like site-specific DNA recombinase
MEIKRRRLNRVLRVVLYLRKSTKKQSQEPSLDQQRRAGKAWVKRIGGKVVGEYSDAGISGVSSADGRPGFAKMRDAAATDAFDVVWAWDVARLSRSDAVRTLNELAPFYDHRVKLAYADRQAPLDLNDLRDLIDMVFQSQSSSETSKAMSKGVGRGCHDIARQGKWVSGRPPLGYVKCKKTRRLILADCAAVAMVRWVFDAYESGESLRGIVREMKARGFASNQMTVRRMLGNILYTGDWLWPRTCQAKLYRQELVDGTALPVAVEDTYIHHPSPMWRRQYQVEPENQYHIPDNHPRIIPRKQFDNVQRILAEGRRKHCTTPNPETRKRLGFAGKLLRCSHCGGVMTGCTVTHGNGGKAVAYHCNNGRSEKGCQPRRVMQAPLMDLVSDTLAELYDNPETAERLASAARKLLKGKPAKTSPAAKLRAAQRELERLTGKYDRATNQTLEAKYADAIADQEELIARLKVEAKAAALSLPEILEDIDRRAAEAAKLFARLRSVRRDPEKWRSILQTVVHEVRVDVQKVGGRWKLKGGEIVLNPGADSFTSYLSQYGTRLLQVGKPVNSGADAFSVPLKCAG